MARHLGPKGIHVALLIIDGSIDTEKTRDNKWLKPEEVANTVHYITSQDKSAWTFQMDIHPSIEKW